MSKMSEFFKEAGAVRESLVHPSFKHVFKLTVYAVIFILISMALVTALDYSCYKLITERIVKKWAAARAKAA